MPVNAENTLKEGIYTAADFDYSPKNLYTIQNVSTEDSICIIVFDENHVELQNIRLNPNSLEYNLIPLKPNYKITILGNGEAFIN